MGRREDDQAEMDRLVNRIKELLTDDIGMILVLDHGSHRGLYSTLGSEDQVASVLRESVLEIERDLGKEPGAINDPRVKALVDCLCRLELNVAANLALAIKCDEKKGVGEIAALIRVQKLCNRSRSLAREVAPDIVERFDNEMRAGNSSCRVFRK